MTIQEYAKREGFDYAEDTGVIWNGYRVYSLDYAEPHFVGEPMFALVKNHEIRTNTPDETWDIFDAVTPVDEDDFEQQEGNQDRIKMSEYPNARDDATGVEMVSSKKLPYFYKNKAWYTYGENGIQLTDQAPARARESYRVYMGYYDSKRKINVEGYVPDELALD